MKAHGNIAHARRGPGRRGAAWQSAAGQSDLERRLAAHYDGIRAAPAPHPRQGECAPAPGGAPSAGGERRRAELVAAMVAEMAASTRAAPSASAAPAPGSTPLPVTSAPPFVQFVAAQARFIGPGPWLAHAALIVVAVALCAAAPGKEAALCAAALVGAAVMLVEAPPLLASRAHGVAELECACLFDHRSALAARMVVLGCSGALLVTALAAAAPLLAGASAIDVLVHACLPYFLACIGCLEIARRTSAANATGAAAAWCLLVAGGGLALWLAAPQLYTATATGTWGLAGAAALAGVLHEAHLLLRQAGQGLDAIAPRAAAA